MNAGEVFVVLMVVLLVFNFGVVMMSGDPYALLAQMAIGGLLGVVVPIAVIAILSGTNVVASGLNAASTRIIFGMGVLLGLLFQITFTVATFTISLGAGLLQNVFGVFAITDLWGIPFLLVVVLGIVILASGLLTFSGGGGGE
jgi:hypothetical protein